MASSVVWTLRESGFATYCWRDLEWFSPDICLPIPMSELNKWTVTPSLSLLEFRSADVAWPRTSPCCGWCVVLSAGVSLQVLPGSLSLIASWSTVSLHPVCRRASTLQFSWNPFRRVRVPVEGSMTLPSDLGSPAVRAQLRRSAPLWAPRVSSWHGHSGNTRTWKSDFPGRVGTRRPQLRIAASRVVVPTRS